MFKVNVYAFDHSAIMDDVRFLQTLKQQQVSLQFIQLPCTSVDASADGALFIYSNRFESDCLIQDQLRTLIRSLSPIPLLCIIPEHLHLDEQWLASFKDFAFWPCGENEFKMRLQYVFQTSKRDEVIDNGLLAEFASLNLIGQSTKFIRNVQLIKRMASCHAAVLIQGETGTGKENAARAIHYLSNRREQGFVPVNCAAIPDELLESELFGYEKGAFTDAKQAQTGLVAFANHGTLFLDEVDSLTPKAQAALLRFLQTQEYRPLGAKQTLQADVRILAATNANLHQLVANKLFREDLYFRLNVLNIVMPPLRERLEDIAAIANSMLIRFSAEHKLPLKRLDRIGLLHLMSQPWPGNIRELENCLLRAFLLTTGPILQFIDSADSYAEDESVELSTLSAGDVIEIEDDMLVNFQRAKALAITRFEENYLQQLMKVTNGNVSAAARLAGKERRALGRLLQKYSIDKSRFLSRSA